MAERPKLVLSSQVIRKFWYFRGKKKKHGYRGKTPFIAANAFFWSVFPPQKILLGADFLPERCVTRH